MELVFLSQKVNAAVQYIISKRDEVFKGEGAPFLNP